MSNIIIPGRNDVGPDRNTSSWSKIGAAALAVAAISSSVGCKCSAEIVGGYTTTESSASADDLKKDEIFTENSVIEYAKLKSWQQEQIRIRFLLDSEQKEEINKICEWFTKKYQAESAGKMSFKDVLRQMLTNDVDKKRVLLVTDVKVQKLAFNEGLKTALERELEVIEKEAAEDLRGRNTDYNNAIREMRRLGGNKVLLAILGDTAARSAIGYEPPKGNPQNLKDLYKTKCEKYVKEANQYYPGFWDWAKFWK